MWPRVKLLKVSNGRFYLFCVYTCLERHERWVTLVMYLQGPLDQDMREAHLWQMSGVHSRFLRAINTPCPARYNAGSDLAYSGMGNCIARDKRYGITIVPI